MMNKTFVALSSVVLAACGHHGEAREAHAERAADSIRQHAAFDLGCPPEQIQVIEVERGTWTRPATFGATCGEKRATYLYRAGTVIRN
jgi:hypothetical protein